MSPHTEARIGEGFLNNSKQAVGKTIPVCSIHISLSPGHFLPSTAIPVAARALPVLRQLIKNPEEFHTTSPAS